MTAPVAWWLALLTPVLAPSTTVESLTATSGASVDLVLDRDPATGWAPPADPSGEVLVLRLSRAHPVTMVHVRLCPGSPPARLSVLLGSSLVTRGKAVSGADRAELYAGGGASGWDVTLITIKVESAAPGFCLAELELTGRGQPLPLLPPRRVAGRAQSSLTLAPESGYGAHLLLDGRTDFGWGVRLKGAAAPPWVELTLQEAHAVHEVELWNGYQRSQGHFARNARAREVSLSGDGQDLGRYPVRDVMGSQRIKLARPFTGRVLRLTVTGHVTGSHDPDLVLSELRLRDGDGPYTVAVPAPAPEADGQLAAVVDLMWVSRCGEDSARSSLKVRSNGMFSAQLETWADEQEGSGEVGTRATTDVLEGTWMVGKARRGPANAITLELMARRTRLSTRWHAATGESRRSADSVAGGWLAIRPVSQVRVAEFSRWISEHHRGPQSPPVGCLPPDDDLALQAEHARLSQAGALLVEGPVMTDLLVPVHSPR